MQSERRRKQNVREPARLFPEELRKKCQTCVQAYLHDLRIIKYSRDSPTILNVDKSQQTDSIGKNYAGFMTESCVRKFRQVGQPTKPMSEEQLLAEMRSTP
jgi:hypothetical protein